MQGLGAGLTTSVAGPCEMAYPFLAALTDLEDLDGGGHPADRPEGSVFGDIRLVDVACSGVIAEDGRTCSLVPESK